MSTTVKAIYDDGKIVLPQALPLPDKSLVIVTIESDSERTEWLQLNEKKLRETWNNSEDDVFNELRAE